MLYAAALKVSEKICLGSATIGSFNAHDGERFRVMSRVVCHTMFFGRWLREDVRVVADYESKLQVCADVSFEALSMYVSTNRSDVEAVDLLARLRRGQR